MLIPIWDPNNVHTEPDPRETLKKKNYTKKCSTKSFKMTLKSLKITGYKQNINLSNKKGSLLLFFQFCIHLINLYIF